MGKVVEVPNGTRYGHLVVLKELEHKPYEKRKFLCKCDCGKEKIIALANIRNGHTKSCGCNNWIKPKTNTDDYIGKRYGKLVVIEGAGYSENRRIQVKCRCDCGKIITIELHAIKNPSDSATKSCGCSRSTHDGITHRSQERLYSIYHGILQRCNNPNYPYFYNYGGRGITVCEEWENSYPAFRKWALANGYAEDLTIDRKDVNGNYEPSNCRWSNMKVQSNNTRKNIIVTYNNETHTLSEWSEITGIKLGRLYARYHRGFSLDVVFSPKRLATRTVYEKREKTT